MNIIKDGLSCVNIVVEKYPVSLFAAEELQKYIMEISGCQIAVNEHADSGKSSIFVGRFEWCSSIPGFDISENDLHFDGYCIKSIGDSIFLTSKMGRGVLFAVYEFLEKLGCRWYFPGVKGEIIPSLKDICLDDVTEISNPDFEIRSVTEGSHKKPAGLWKDEMFEVIDWTSKNKLNSINVHQNPNEDLKGIDSVKREIEKRGLIFEFGGHGTQGFVQRELFEQKPEMFREKDGIRRKDGNFCGSSDEAISYIIDGVRQVLEKIGDIDILHLFFDDVYGGSWCECPKCRQMSNSDQQLNVINKVYTDINKEYSTVRGDMCLYHDTLEIDKLTISPLHNVIGYYAPRERCYSHSIGDPSCKRNVEFYRRLKGAVEKFGDNAYVFEYYADLILYSKMKVCIPKVIVNDLKDYKMAGVNKITQLMFLRYSWWAYAFNMYLFAKATWDLNYDHIEGLNEFCRTLYPENFDSILEYYDLIEKSSYGILGFCGYDYNDFLLDIREIPIQTPEFYFKHMQQIGESIKILENCSQLLDRLLQDSTGRERILLMDEKQILRITLKEARAIHLQMSAIYLFNMDKSIDVETIKALVDKAVLCKQEIIKIIEAISDELKGNSGNDSIFVNHLCNDQIEYLCKLKESFVRE